MEVHRGPSFSVPLWMVPTEQLEDPRLRGKELKALPNSMDLGGGRTEQMAIETSSSLFFAQDNWSIPMSTCSLIERRCYKKMVLWGTAAPLVLSSNPLIVPPLVVHHPILLPPPPVPFEPLSPPKLSRHRKSDRDRILFYWLCNFCPGPVLN